MAASGPKSIESIGFLTIREQSEQGFLGGYLILNRNGRPLEFHCTVPVRPNRAQQILYGPTLRPFLYGEQIGKTLVAKAKQKPLLVCTDVAPAIELADHVPVPVVLVEPRNNKSRDLDGTDRVDGPHGLPSAHFQLKLGHNTVLARHESERKEIQDSWQKLDDDFDLWEPFQRIHEAIDEAQRGAASRT